jgi:hypothetical protein
MVSVLPTYLVVKWRIDFIISRSRYHLRLIAHRINSCLFRRIRLGIAHNVQRFAFPLVNDTPPFYR